MTITKIFNHNVVIARDCEKRECVLTGKGVGFNKQVGSAVDMKRVEKTFVMKEKGTAEKLSRIIQNIPSEYVKVSDEIINMAKKELGNSLNENIYLTLTDHLSFAIQRHQNGINLTSSLRWEMKQLYSTEFTIGLKALEIIDKRLNISFPEDEAAYIAFHFVNAGSAGLDVSYNLAFVQDIFNIVKKFFEINMDEESLSYNRFLNHLKYLSYRVLNGGSLPNGKTDTYMLNRFQIDLPKESECTEQIAEYIVKSYNYVVRDCEKEYLIIHLHSMLTR